MDAGNEYSGKLISKLLCITERRLQQLASEGVIPKASRGKYPLVACVQAYIKYLQQRGGNDGVLHDPDTMEPFKRRAYYQSELEKLKLGQECGELIPRIEVEQEQARILRMCALSFDTLADVVERDCGATPDVVHRIERITDDLRENLYRELCKDDPQEKNGTED